MGLQMPVIQFEEVWDRYTRGNDLEQLAIAVYVGRGDRRLIEQYRESSELLRWFWSILGTDGSGNITPSGNILA